MIRPKTLYSYQIRKLFILTHPSPYYSQNPKPVIETHSILSKSLIPISIFSRSFSLSSLFQQDLTTQESNDKSNKSNKSLEAFFKEAIGFQDSENEKENLKKNLRTLEVEFKKTEKDLTNETKKLETFFVEAVGLSEKEESEQGLKKLSNLFLSDDEKKKLKRESKRQEELMEIKELSPEMAIFAKCLHTKGYLNDANFISNDKFDVSCFVNNYGRDFLKFAAEKFAKDHREVYKWLPEGDLNIIAQFGCPSLGRKTVFSAKAMRFCFGIQEEKVCKKCMLKEACKFANQSVWKKGAKNIDLVVVMRVITLYALDSVPNQLQVPDDVKNAANRLLNEVIRLSEIES
ncbi:uncharacterized protein [Rutidosis leptorrhynchoides]|uniref:uncharacterized protein n=1 Tax=Rutidosis leptorrhynchoides TaxID=125765 RepID=UPI003A98D419